jgi:hypothetical protein
MGRNKKAPQNYPNQNRVQMDRESSGLKEKQKYQIEQN